MRVLTPFFFAFYMSLFGLSYFYIGLATMGKVEMNDDCSLCYQLLAAQLFFFLN